MNDWAFALYIWIGRALMQLQVWRVRNPGAITIIAALASAIVVLSLSAQPAASSSDVSRALTEAEQVRELSVEDANRHHPVRLQGTVAAVGTFFIFLNDETAGIAVIARGGLSNGIQAGQRVIVEGFTSCPDFAPEIDASRVFAVGPGSLPVPKQASFEQLASTREDSQWVEIDGVVRSVLTDEIRDGDDVDARTAVKVALAGGNVLARVPWLDEAAASKLIGDRLRLRGTAGAVYNPRGDWVGVRLFVPDEQQIDILARGDPDSFQAPIRSIQSVLRFNLDNPLGARIHVRGTVTLQRSGRTLFLSEGTSNIMVIARERTAVEPGDEIDVVGFAAPGQYTHILDDALFRKLRTGRSPQHGPLASNRH